MLSKRRAARRSATGRQGRRPRRKPTRPSTATARGHGETAAARTWASASPGWSRARVASGGPAREGAASSPTTATAKTTTAMARPTMGARAARAASKRPARPRCRMARTAEAVMAARRMGPTSAASRAARDPWVLSRDAHAAGEPVQVRLLRARRSTRGAPTPRPIGGPPARHPVRRRAIELASMPLGCWATSGRISVARSVWRPADRRILSFFQVRRAQSGPARRAARRSFPADAWSAPR